MNKEELKKKLSDTSLDDEEILKYRGELIALIKKDISASKDASKLVALRVMLYEELKKHKEHIKKMEKENNSVVSLPKNVGLKVKEISTAIKIFMEKNDVLNKVKSSLINTGVSTIIVGGISLGISLFAGTLSIATLAGIVPTISYIALSNIIRNGITPNAMTKLFDSIDNKDAINKEATEFAKQYIINNEEFINLLSEKTKTKDRNQLMIINEKLVGKYKEIIKQAPNEMIKYSLSFELINIMQELKKIYETKKKDFIKDREKMTNVEFVELEKKSLTLDVDLFKEENFLKDASANAFNNIKVNTVTMYLARIILSAVFPSLRFETINDLITPFIFTVINSITNIDNFKEKIPLKDSKYTDTIVRINRPDLFKNLIKQNSPVLA